MSHISYFKIYRNGEIENPGDLLEILALDKERFTAEGKEILDYLESEIESTKDFPTYRDFKWKLSAFIEMQDMLAIPIVSGSKPEHIFQLNYFYYESKYLLLESIISSLNGLHIANRQLLRSFMEFNLLQLYFRNQIFRKNSIKPFTDYLQYKNNPGLTSLINKAIPDDDFCKPIKKRLQIEFKNLANRFSHAYEPSDSPKHLGVFMPSSSIETLYFWFHTAVVLDIVLWMYYVNLPMLFYPLDTIKKFGLNPPMGVYASPSTNILIQKATTTDDYKAFLNYASQHPNVEELIGYYNSFPDLTEEQQWETWKEEKDADDTILSCQAKSIAKIRATNEVLAVKYMSGIMEKESINTEVHQNFSQFSKWSKIYKKMS